MVYSRLSRVEEKRTKKQLLLVILGIVGLTILVSTIGIPFLVKTSVLLGNLKSKQPLGDTSDKTPPLPPIFSNVVSATNSATLKLDGYGEPETTLTLFINDEEVKKIILGIDGVFSFPDIVLDKGINIVYGILTDAGNNESAPSKTFQVTYKKDAPKLDVSEPQEGQTFGKNQQEIMIKGMTDERNEVWINGRFVSVGNDGSFTFTLRLNDGENTLVISSKDAAGNETKLERKVTYQP